MISLTELNTNPIYQPPKEWLIPYKIHKMVQDYFNEPVLLKNITKKISSHYGGEWIKLDDKKFNYLPTGEPICPNSIALWNKEFEQHLMKKVNERKQEKEEVECDLFSKRFEISAYISRGYNGLQVCLYENEYKIYKKGNKLSDLEEEGFNRKYNNYVDSFNIIEKDFKIMDDKKRDSYKKRYFHTKPFEQFPETGIEVLFVNSGFQSNGKRTANFNRGAVWNLKQTCKNNNIKNYSKLSKNDLNKLMIKL